MVKGRVEELSLQLQVDVLISEPMGTLLVNERMLETYLYARDRFLKPGAPWEPFFSRVLHKCVDYGNFDQRFFKMIPSQPFSLYEKRPILLCV